jgi:Ca2+-binding RTX toxin-like protein
MVIKHCTAAPLNPREDAFVAEETSGSASLLILALGVLFLTLGAGSVLADSFHGGATHALRGTEGDDRLTGSGGDDGIWGLGGDDDLYGGEGRELILGGEGDDFIEAKDGEADFVGCGPGDDVASVDSVDHVEGDCETLYPG